METARRRRPGRPARPARLRRPGRTVPGPGDLQGPLVATGFSAGVVVLGDQDDDVRDDAVPAIDQLRAAGLTCRLDAVAGLGHDFPSDFVDRLPDLLTELVG